MEVVSSKDSSVASSPFSSPNISALLKIKIVSWSQETGLPVSIRIRVSNRTFNLHKYPLFSKSGYFKKRLNEPTEHELPEEFPGGPETFEMIALFIYSSSTLTDPFNVAALRCAAEFLEMKEEYCAGNLCERFDLYLNQVVLQSWDDTLIVLQRCQTLLPWAEELLIVSRCIESLAFMACMEILDPERRREKPVVMLEALVGQVWCCERVKGMVSQDLWIKDLIALPFGFFRRIIGSLDCQKLSQEACIEAVQNEMMPLRVIVQALFVQQLNTHQAFKNCSDSFRYMHCGEFSGSLPSSRCPNSKSQNPGESPCTDGAEPDSRPLSFLLTKDLGMHSCEFSRKDYESTSFRIQNVEQELMSLKKSLDRL